MNIAVFTGNHNAVTMSSREIAELCEKRHDHVIRDIEKMLTDINDPKLGAVDFRGTYNDSKGEERKEYRLPRNLTITLITGYRADLRFKVVKRLEELEGVNPALALDLNNPTQLRGLLANYLERTEVAESRLKEIEPKAQALDRLEASEGSLVPRMAAKALGVPEKKFTKWLVVNSWAFRQSGKGPLQGYSGRIKQDYVEHRIDTYECPTSGVDKQRVQLMITAKGMARLAQIFASDAEAA